VVAATLSTAWVYLMVEMSGGWQPYWHALHRIVEFQSVKTVARGGWNALYWNLFFSALFCWNGLILGAAVLAGALLYRASTRRGAWKLEWDFHNKMAVRTLWLWILPMMLLQVLVGYTETPGHILAYLLGWLLVVGVIVGQLQKRWKYVTVVAAICGTNIYAFVAWPRAWDGFFFGMARTARELREHDRELAQIVGAIRSQLDPKETIICEAHEYLPLGLKHLQLYLPEFEQYQLAIDPVMPFPTDKPMMRIRGGHLGFAGRIDLTGKRVLALVVPRGTSLEDYASHVDLSDAELLPNSDGSVYTVPSQSWK